MSKIIGLAIGSVMIASASYAAVAGKGLVCINQEQLSSDWTIDGIPLLSSVAHWFDDKRVSTVTWSRTNDNVKIQTTRRGVPYKTDAVNIQWKIDVGGKDGTISIDRRTAVRSVLQGGTILVSVDCDLFDNETEFQKKLDEMTNHLQSKYDLAIANHKL